MKTSAFIGDVHGCSRALADLLETVKGTADRLVFLGDYVNRGPDSRGVIDQLLRLEESGEHEVVFLAGNHDAVLLASLDQDQAFLDLLRMGGSSTVRSYVDAPYRDVQRRLRQSFPDSHREFLARLVPTWTDGGVFAVHDARDAPQADTFVVAGHAAQVSSIPRVTENQALIDTGCGTTRAGRLTCFYWPSKEWVQSVISGI